MLATATDGAGEGGGKATTGANDCVKTPHLELGLSHRPASLSALPSRIKEDLGTLYLMFIHIQNV